MSGYLLIESEPDGICDLCGATAETRPYGPKGEEVCFPCGMKDEHAAIKGVGMFIMGMPAEIADEYATMCMNIKKGN